MIMLILGMVMHAQDSLLITTDGVKHETREIDLAKISLESNEIIFSLVKELRQVISDEDLLELEFKVDLAVGEVDSLIKYKKDTFVEMKNMRSIRNLISFWKQKYMDVLAIDGKIANMNKELDKNRLKYARELAAWNGIKGIAIEYNYEEAVMGRIDLVIQMLDSAIALYGQKSNVTLGMLNKTSRSLLLIDEKIDIYDQLLITKQKNIFKSGHPGFFHLDFSNPENWKIGSSFQLLHRGELRALGAYFRNHASTAIWHFFLLIAAILFFFFLKRSGIPEGENEDINYRRSLKIIISNPGNSALILVLFLSTLLYPNKPVLFNDLLRIVVSVPLMITLLNLAHRKYWSIIIAFEVLILLQIINANLSTHLIPARILMLLTAVMEIITLAGFIVKIKDAHWRHPYLQQIAIILCFLHLGIAAAGIFTNLAGKVLLTQSLLNAVSGTVLAAVLIFMALLVGNGLMMIFIDSKYANYVRVVANRKQFMKEQVTRIFQLLAGIFILYYILEAYGFDIYVGEGIKLFFQKERTLGSVTFTWGRIVIFFVVIWLSAYISKLIRIFLEEEVLDRMGLAQGLPNTIALMVRYTIVTLGVLAAASAAGLKMSNLTIILGALGVGIGFGLQNIFNNLVSGLILLLERPIKIGDTIEVGNLIGVVKHIGIRASNIHTYDGAEIIVPNGQLISNEVINWTLTDKRRRIEVMVGVAYGTDVYKAQEILLNVITSHKEVVKDPIPYVFFNQFGDSSLEFRLLFWTDNFDEWVRIRSEVVFLVHDALKQAGITIPFPQRDVHIKSQE